MICRINFHTFAFLFLQILFWARIYAAPCTGLTTVTNQRNFLQDLYEACNGENWNWGLLPGQRWNFSAIDSDPCADNWQGLACVPNIQNTECQIESLFLTNYTLVGSLPSSIGNLTNARHLNLSDNFIVGEIPQTISVLTNLERIELGDNLLNGSISMFLSELTGLTYFSLASNQLTGSVPEGLLDPWTNLMVLDLSDNALTGSLPQLTETAQLTNTYSLMSLELLNNHFNGSLSDSLCSFSSLTLMDVQGNALTGTLPDCLGSSLTALKVLSLNYNSLNGTLPISLFSTQLKVLSIQYNDFFGTLSAAMVNMHSIEHLMLRNNHLHGPLPTWIGQLTTLTYLSLGGNLFHGTVPSELGSLVELGLLAMEDNRYLFQTLPDTLHALSKLFHLDLKGNLLNGSLPSYIGDTMTRLTYLNLENNFFRGTVPTSYGQLPQLFTLSLAFNRLKGTVPAFLSGCSQLTLLDLSGNDFHGSLPEEYYAFPQLKHLSFHSSYLNGTVSNQLGALSSLTFLSMYYNSMTGTLPSSIGNLSELVYFSLNDNLFGGSIPLTLTNLKRLEQFYFFNNPYLNGTLPESLGAMTALVQLIVGNTSIHGTIPTSFCNLTNLLTFGLGVNCLTGSLPECLGDITGLESFYISDNRLTGTFPTQLGSMHNFIAINISNNYLTGVIPTQLCSVPLLSYINVGSNKLHGLIPDCLGQLSQLQYFLLNGNNFDGSIPASLGSMKSLRILQLFDNTFSGTLPSTLGQLSTLQNALLQNNMFSGKADVLFESNYSAITTIDISENRFTGSIPMFGAYPELLPRLNTIHAISNCFTGSLTSDICNLKSAKSLYLDGLTSGETCTRRLGITGRTTDTFVEGTIPSCLYSMPTLTSLSLSGNGWECSIPDDNVTTSLIYLDLSHNQLTGTIPFWIQQRYALTYLELSFNRLSGKVSSMDNFTLVQGIGNDSTPTELYLRNNRLSGRLPEYFEMAQTIDVLEGNLFGCASRSSLPRNDPYVDKYFCGSSDLDISYMFLISMIVALLLAELLVAALLFHYPPDKLWASVRDKGVYVVHLLQGVFTCSTERAKQAMEAFKINVPTVYTTAATNYISLIHTQVFFMTLWDLRKFIVTASLIVFVIFLPTFTVLKTVEGGRYATRTVQYGWVISGAYLEGMLPTIVLETLLSVLFIGLFFFQYRTESNTYHIHESMMRYTMTAQDAATIELLKNKPTMVDHSSAMQSVSSGNPLTARTTAYNERNTMMELESQLNTSHGTNERLESGTFHRDKRLVTTSSTGYDAASLSPRLKRWLVAKHIGFRLLQFLGNCILVLVMNGLYVTVELYESIEVRYLCTILIAVFKVAWNIAAVPAIVGFVPRAVRLPRELARKEYLIGFALQHACIVSNVLLIPCIATAVANSSCFLDVFLSPPTVDITLTYFQCIDSAAITRNITTALDQYNVDSCVRYSDSVPYIETFSAPFFYSYECSSALITTYTPVYMLQYGFGGIVMPIVEIFAFRWIRKRYYAENPDAESDGPLSIDSIDQLRCMTLGVVGNVFWPVKEIIRQKVLNPLRKHNRNFRFTPMRNMVFNMVGAVSVMLTFGVTYPPLAVMIAVSMISTVTVRQYFVQAHIDECAAARDNYSEQSRTATKEPSMHTTFADGQSDESSTIITAGMQRSYLCKWMERDCFLLHTVFPQAFDSILISTSLFYGLYFYDMSSGSLWAAWGMLVITVVCSGLMRWIYGVPNADHVNSNVDREKELAETQDNPIFYSAARPKVKVIPMVTRKTENAETLVKAVREKFNSMNEDSNEEINVI